MEASFLPSLPARIQYLYLRATGLDIIILLNFGPMPRACLFNQYIRVFPDPALPVNSPEEYRHQKASQKQRLVLCARLIPANIRPFLLRPGAVVLKATKSDFGVCGRTKHKVWIMLNACSSSRMISSPA